MNSRPAKELYSIAILLVSFTLAVWLLIPAASTGDDVFYVCSNSKSPVAQGRSDLLAECCAGSPELQESTPINLMQAMETVRMGVRAVAKRKSGELESAGTPDQKMDCLVSSVEFLADAMKAFNPPKNAKNKKEFDAQLDQLKGAVRNVRKAVTANYSIGSLRAYDSFTDTCVHCHATFK